MLNKRAINVIIKHIALLVKKSSVDVGLDSKQLVKKQSVISRYKHGIQTL